MSGKKHIITKLIFGFLLLGMCMAPYVQTVHATGVRNQESTETNEVISPSRKNNDGGTETGSGYFLTQEDGFGSYLSSERMERNQDDNAYGSWVAGTDAYRELYGNDYIQHVEDDDRKTSDMNWVSKAIGTLFQWESFGLNELASILGLTVDNIVFGRLAEGVNISMFQFGMEYKNPFGTIGSMIYGTLRDSVVLYLIALCIGLTFFWHLINKDKDTLKKLKADVGMAVIVLLLLYIMPNLTDLFLFLRDAMTALIIDMFKGEMGISGLQFDIFNTLYNYVESDVGFVTGLILIMCSGAGLFLGWNYVKNGMIAFALFAFFPIILILCFFNKKLLSQWAVRFYGVLVIPFVDACLLMVPLFFTRMETNKSAFFVAMAMFFCIIPTRDGILALIGIRPERSGGYFAAMLAMRALGGLGRGAGAHPSGAPGSSAAAAGAMTNTEKADMLEAMGEAGGSAPIPNPLQDGGYSSLGNDVATAAALENMQGGLEQPVSEPIGDPTEALAATGTAGEGALPEDGGEGSMDAAITDPVIPDGAQESLVNNGGMNKSAGIAMADDVTGNGGLIADEVVPGAGMVPGDGVIPEEVPASGGSLAAEGAQQSAYPGETDGTLQAGAAAATVDNANSQVPTETAAISSPVGKADAGFDLSTRQGNLKMMDATRDDMRTIQAKIHNNDLMGENAQYRKQIGKLNEEHSKGAIGDAEYARQVEGLNAEIGKNDALIAANNEKIPGGYHGDLNNKSLEKQYKNAQRTMEACMQREREFANRAEAMGYGNRTYSSEASYRRAQDLMERKRAFVTTDNFEHPAFKDVLSYSEQADLYRERKRLSQKREVEKRVLRTAGSVAGAMAAAPVGLAFMGISGPESALMGAMVGGAMGSGLGGKMEKLSPERASSLQDIGNHQQAGSQNRILSENQAREKARAKAEQIETRKAESKKEDPLERLYDDQSRLARQGIDRLNEMDKP